MNDSTILKPRPGARDAPEPSPANPGDDRTALASPRGRVDTPRDRLRIPSTRLGAVCDQASGLLSLADRVGEAGQVEDIQRLRRQCTQMVRDYQSALTAQGVDPAVVNTASYCLCALLDELILNTEWGQQGDWAAQSLLSEFHTQTVAGEHFFELVERSRRSGDADLLMLQYLCLCLGFQGKYRLESHGRDQLESLRDQLYREISQLGGRRATPFDDHWKHRLVSGQGLSQRVPLWVVAAVCAVVLLMVYLGFSHQLGQAVAPVNDSLTRLGIPERVDSGGSSAQLEAEAAYLEQMLQSEIQRDLITLERENGQVNLIIGGDTLFDAGQARIRDEARPILSKMGRALEATDSRLLVSGHTGTRAIATPQYPSNWHLSLARATAVADALADSGNLDGRLWPEGRGEAQPRYDGDDDSAPEGGNRRVEISLIP